MRHSSRPAGQRRPAWLGSARRPDEAWLRDRLAAELAHAGVDDVVHLGDRLETTDGTTFGVGTLADALSRHPRLTWGSRVRAHARTLARVRATPVPLATPDVLARAVARVVADDATDVRDGGGAEHLGPLLAPGLRAVVCLDLPEHVHGPVDLRPHGGWTAVAPAALAALRALPAPRHRTLTAEGGGAVEVFVADDVFGASRLLVLDALVADALGRERPEHGMLVVVPNRHLLAVHPLEDAGTVVGALRLMLTLAGAAAASGAGPVSPAVYYRSPDGTLERVTHQPLVDGLGDDSALRRAVLALPVRRSGRHAA
ncbi:hypothetical protein [Cellulomonas marina]|uniref:Uncharacterized protein n=1 Tax=Cellulomonas marina TaxID=988821 RepID=A0A1I0XR58_9CELL|nr:hypothetical protein [Cellulomonas marina]GIG30065.1 hypothetical protein Cma02nite_26650 [Cellulomonas marina]SFB02688.1 hypothetical protein SAMN05421867_105189 [Cellulomonas marina]